MQISQKGNPEKGMELKAIKMHAIKTPIRKKGEKKSKTIAYMDEIEKEVNYLTYGKPCITVVANTNYARRVIIKITSSEVRTIEAMDLPLKILQDIGRLQEGFIKDLILVYKAEYNRLHEALLQELGEL